MSTFDIVDRSRRRIVEATAAAAVLGGAPSTILAVATGGVERGVAYAFDTTRRVGVLLPPFRPSLARGMAAHLVVSLVAGEALARVVPRRRSVVWGAAAGLAMGVANVGVIGRRIPAIAELPLWPQLADNVAFGVVFAIVADRATRASSASRVPAVAAWR